MIYTTLTDLIRAITPALEGVNPGFDVDAFAREISGWVDAGDPLPEHFVDPHRDEDDQPKTADRSGYIIMIDDWAFWAAVERYDTATA